MFPSARPDLLSFEPGYDQRAKKLSWLSSKPFCHAAAELSRSFLLGESIRDPCCSSGNYNQGLRWTSLGANAYDVQSKQPFALNCKRRVRCSLFKKVYEIPRSRWFAQRIFRFGGVWNTDLSFNQSPAGCFCGQCMPFSARGRHVFLPTCCQAFTTIFQMLFVHGYGTKLTPWITNALFSLFAARESVR